MFIESKQLCRIQSSDTQISLATSRITVLRESPINWFRPQVFKLT
jgi:hypothetical protein